MQAFKISRAYYHAVTLLIRQSFPIEKFISDHWSLMKASEKGGKLSAVTSARKAQKTLNALIQRFLVGGAHTPRGCMKKLMGVRENLPILPRLKGIFSLALCL